MRPPFRPLLLILVLAVCACGRRVVPTFPDVKPIGGLPHGTSWRLENGPDFYVYRAVGLPSHNSEVGIYFGTAPSFKPPEGAVTQEGRVAAHTIAWVLSASGPPFRADTVFPYRHSAQSLELRLHVWVATETPEDRTTLLRHLQDVRFVNSGPAFYEGPTVK